MTGARLAVAALTAAAAFMAGRTLLVGDAAEAAPARLALPPLPDDGRRDLAILHAHGSLESGAAATGFVPAPEGSVLAAGQTLRVGGGAEAVLRLGVASRLSLSAGSELTAVELTPSALTLRLDSGKAEVELLEPGRTLRISSSDGAEVIAIGAPGTRFLVAAHPGRLAVINAEGADPVRMIAAGESVQVPERRVSWSVHGAAPRPPIEPPSDPELEIISTLPATPAGESADETTPKADESDADAVEAAVAAIVIRGRTHPLSLLKIGGVVVEVAADGSFEVTLPKPTGPTQLLASLPTGDEAILEVPAAAADGTATDAAVDGDGATGSEKQAAEDAAAETAAAEKAAAEELAAEELAAEKLAASQAEPVVEEPAKPKPEPRVKRKKPRRQKKAQVSRKKSQKRTQKPAAAKKKAGVVTWGAAP